MAKDVVLAIANPNLPYEIYSDASNLAAGFVLVQNDRPIMFGSKMFNAAQKNYSVTDKEVLAMVMAVKKFWCYIKGTRVTLFTDHKPLVTFLDNVDATRSARECRWWEKLSRLDSIIVHIAGNANVVADVLSRNVRGHLCTILALTGLPLENIRQEQLACPETRPYFDALESGTLTKLFDVGNVTLVKGVLYHIWSRTLDQS